MTAPSVRPRRSRTGLVLVLLLGALAAWEVTARVTGVAMVTPLRFAQAAWAVAGGGALPGGAGAPSEEDIAQMAYRPLPYLNYGLKPNWTRHADKPDAPKKTSNSLGFRGDEVQVPKPAGRYRIACLGGSTTYDDGVADDEAYPLRLQQILRAARPEADIEVVNCGVPSYTTAESVANLAFRVVDLQPDAIVLYEGINDWRTRNYANFDSAYFHYRKVWDGSARHWETGEGELAGGINPLIQLKPPVPNGNPAENIQRSGSFAFRRNLESMAGIARAHGIEVVLVNNVAAETDPYVPPDQFRFMLDGIAAHNEVVRDVARVQGALFVDLAAAWPKGAAIPQGGLFVDAVHNNPAGSLLKARLIADALLKDLLK